MTWYRTEEEAFARARRLRRELGIWPGVTGPVVREGGLWWRLTFNPPDQTAAQWRGMIEWLS